MMTMPVLLIQGTEDRVNPGEKNAYVLIDHLPDGTGRLVFRCPPGELPWFARYFAGLGTDADVRAPDTLREQLARLGHTLAVQYGQ